MLQNIALSFQGLWSHKLRSFLTMLGIIIGIAAIIAIWSTITGTNEQIKNNLIGAGSNSASVSLMQGDWAFDFQWNGVPENIRASGCKYCRILNKWDEPGYTREGGEYLTKHAHNEVCEPPSHGSGRPQGGGTHYAH